MSNELDNRTLNETDIQTAVEIIPGQRKNIILDATVLTSLMNCPRYTDFRFNLNLVSIKGKSNSLECGSIVHKYLETYYKNLINGFNKELSHQAGMASAEMYIKGCIHCTDFISSTEQNKPVCGHQPNEYPGVINTSHESEGYKIGWKWVLDTCEQYHQFYRNDFWVPLEVETVKSRILYEDEEIRILWKAKLDWVGDTNEGIYPMDHKTMKQRRDTKSLNNQFIGQCIIMDTRRVFINKIGFQTSLKPEEKFLRPPISYSAARLIEWQSETLPYYGKLLLMYAESGHFPPNYAHCEGKYGDCSFYDVCQSEPNCREDELKRLFKVGPEWNPTNEVIED